MAKKLSEEDISRISAMGIVLKLKTEEEARPKLIEYLAENGLDGVEDDAFKDLVDFGEVFVEETKPAKTPVKAVETKPVKGKKVVEPEPEEEEEEAEEEEEISEEEEGDEYDDMERPDLIKALKAIDPAFKILKSMTDDSLRDQIRTLSENVEPEEEEEEEEEIVEEAPKKPVNKKAAEPAKTASKKTPEPAVTKAKTEVKKTEVKPVTAAKTTGRTSLPGEKFDARNNPKHKVYLKPFEKLFPEADFEITLLKQGFTIRVLGKNAPTTIFNFDELKISDGKLFGNLYTNRFRSVDDLKETLPEEYHEKEIGMFRMESHPSIRKVSQDELFDIFENSELIRVSLDRANAKDIKMGANREKLEETLKTGIPVKTVAKTVAKTPETVKAVAKVVAKTATTKKK